MKENKKGYGIYVPEPRIYEILEEGFSYPNYVYETITKINSIKDIDNLYEIINKLEDLSQIETEYKNKIRAIQTKYDEDRLKGNINEDIYTNLMIEIAQKYKNQIESNYKQTSNHKSL